MPAALFEMLININIVAVWMTGLLKTVHVELADEGGKVAVLEVLRQDLLREPNYVFYIEAIPS